MFRICRFGFTRRLRLKGFLFSVPGVRSAFKVGSLEASGMYREYRDEGKAQEGCVCCNERGNLLILPTTQNQCIEFQTKNR